MVGLACVGLVATLTKAESGTDVSTSTQAGTLLDGMWLAPVPDARRGPSPTPVDTATEPTGHHPSVTADTPLPGAGASPGATLETQSSTSPPAGPPPGVTSDGKVILNTASAAELRRLPGVGQKRAEKIIELRTRLKRFKKTTDLLRIRGIGVKSLKRMLPHLVLDVPEPADPAPPVAPPERSTE